MSCLYLFINTVGASSCYKQQNGKVLSLQLREYSVKPDVSYSGTKSFEDIMAMRKNYLTPTAVPFYRKPLLIHKGEMQYLYDHKGAQYLDMFGGIVTVSVGHCHPYVNI